MKQLLQKGLLATKDLFASVSPLFAWFLQVAEILNNQERFKAEEIQQRFKDMLETLVRVS